MGMCGVVVRYERLGSQVEAVCPGCLGWVVSERVVGVEIVVNVDGGFLARACLLRGGHERSCLVYQKRHTLVMGCNRECIGTWEVQIMYLEAKVQTAKV